MRYFVEIRTLPQFKDHPSAIYGTQWETPAITLCDYDNEDQAMEMYRAIRSDHMQNPIVAVGIRREGQSHHYVSWNDYPSNMVLRINPRKTSKDIIVSEYSLYMCADNPFDVFAEFIKRASTDVYTRRLLPALNAGNYMLNFE